MAGEVIFIFMNYRVGHCFNGASDAEDEGLRRLEARTREEDEAMDEEEAPDL